MTATLEERIQRLEDLEAIRYLKHHYYCHLVDRSIAGDKAAIDEMITRFCDDISIDFTGIGLVEGFDPVCNFYREALPMVLRWTQHRVMSEAITIDGDTASAVWYVDCPMDGVPEDNFMGWAGSGFIAGRYQEEYLRVDGVWKWKKIVALLDIQTNFATNWQGAKFLTSNQT
jgi:hypothetical protein